MLQISGSTFGLGFTATTLGGNCDCNFIGRQTTAVAVEKGPFVMQQRQIITIPHFIPTLCGLGVMAEGTLF